MRVYKRASQKPLGQELEDFLCEEREGSGGV
jgi:hypothetical protein